MNESQKMIAPPLSEVKFTQKQIARFWRKVDKTSNPNGCWLWTGCRIQDGYGRGSIKSRLFLAHRMAYHIQFGPIPEHLKCLHRCDNPPCVNPEHLWIGTDQDNSIDRELKGRHGNIKGERHGRAKMSETDVLAARESYDYGQASIAKLARRYKTSESAMFSIVKRLNWTHLP